MKRIAVLASGLALAVLPTALRALDGGRDGEVRAVTVQPASGKVEVVVALQGAVEVHDFTLANPARLVLDLVGARLTAPTALYDGQNRGGVKNVRYAQFRPDVVRVVVDLDAVRDYQIQRSEGQVRVQIGTDASSFGAWSSETAGATTPVAAAAAAPAPPVTPAPSPDDAARVSTPAATPTAVDAYLAMHRDEAAQSQAPRINVQWDDAEIADVVSGFAAFSGRTIVIGTGISGKVTAEIKNQPWDLAFAAVLDAQGLAYQTKAGGIIIVVKKTDLARADSTTPVETRLVRVNYAKASSLVPAVLSLLTKNRGQVVADTTNNALVITEVSNRIDDVVSFVRGLDIRTPQVSIQAKIIFVDRTDVEELGLRYDLGTQTQFFNKLVQRPDPSTAKPVDTNLDGIPDALVPTGTFSADQTIVDLGGNQLSALGNADAVVINPALDLIFSTALGNFNLTSFVQALQRVELADVQAEPSITTIDNRPAQILVGDRVPLRVIDQGTSVAGGGAQPPRSTVRFEDTGIKLQVTPHVTANRQILMEVHAERSAVKPSTPDIGFTIQTQQADNQILLDDGETAVIGGLTVTTVNVTKSGIPFLVDLPLIGGLFGFRSNQEERQDLLILITPHIVDDVTSPAASGAN